MKSFNEIMAESFVSNITNLNNKDLSKLTKTKIEFSKFIKLEKSTDAIYKCVIFDDNENEYYIHKIIINAFVNKKHKFEIFQPEDEGFQTLKDAIKHIK